MRIGLIDVDGHNFPNFALMKISAYHKAKGDEVVWYDAFAGHCDRVYMSKIFTFSPDYTYYIDADEVLKGGTGYDIKSRLDPEIEACRLMDYSIYPQYPFSIQFYSRGCIRHCPFCLVHDKEGGIQPVEPHQLNPNGEWIEVLDNNFFANPQWREAVADLKAQKKPVKFHGVDVRIMTEEMAEALSTLRLHNRINIAWDLPKLDLEQQIGTMVKYLGAGKISCYVLVGFNSTMEQDLHRLEVLKKFNVKPFVQPYRDFENTRKPLQYEKDLAHWANKTACFFGCDFKDFEPRKGFKCSQYFNS